MGSNIIGETIEGIANLPSQIASKAVKTAFSNTSLVSDQNQINVLKQQEQNKRQSDLSAVRANLKSLIAPKPKPQTNPPACISGKPGFSIEKIQKMQKLKEDSKKKLPALSANVRQGQGSGEMGKFVAG